MEEERREKRKTQKEKHKKEFKLPKPNTKAEVYNKNKNCD